MQRASLAFAADGSLIAHADTIDLAAGQSIATSGIGSIDLTADRNIVLNDGSSLTTVDGGITLSANVAGKARGNFFGLEANNVTIVSYPILSRALYYSTELESYVPEGLYVAVAQVLAYVFQLKQYKKGQGNAPRPLGRLKIPDEFVQMANR